MKPIHFITLSFLLFFQLPILNAGPISLSDALKKGLVKAEITGKKSDTSFFLNRSYYGPCISLDLHNLSTSSLSLILENGRFLETLDTNEQRMIVTRQALISLLPGKKRTYPIYAMCTQMHDASPRPQSVLALGAMATGGLLQLTQFIGTKNYQDHTGQEAIWAITDNNDLSNIYSENAQELKEMLQIVSKITGKPVPEIPQPIEYAEGSVSGEIIFHNKQSESYSMILEDESGKEIVTFFENQLIEKPVKNTLSWKFRYKGFPKGIYYVKLFTKSGEIEAKRPVVVH
jgi:hypothetical protein